MESSNNTASTNHLVLDVVLDHRSQCYVIAILATVVDQQFAHYVARWHGPIPVHVDHVNARMLLVHQVNFFTTLPVNSYGKSQR